MVWVAFEDTFKRSHNMLQKRPSIQKFPFYHQIAMVLKGPSINADFNCFQVELPKTVHSGGYVSLSDTV